MQCQGSALQAEETQTAGTAVVSASACLTEDEHADDESSLEDTIDTLEDEEEAETLAPGQRRKREAQAPEESTSLHAVEEHDEEEAALQQALAMSVQEGTGAAGTSILCFSLAPLIVVCDKRSALFSRRHKQGC